MTNICVVNKSTLVNDEETQIMTRACARQLRYHAAPLYGLHPVPVTYLPDTDAQIAPPGSWVIALLDDADQADALGWHTEEQGELIYGRVFARPVLDNGGKVLDSILSVASVLSHEVLETFADPHCNLWAASPDALYAFEICDPVESDVHPINMGGQMVTVSNFVTPAWFDSNAARGANFDWLGQLSAPFEIGPGGYVVKMEGGEISQQFGRDYPEWRKETKRTDLARSARR